MFVQLLTVWVTWNIILIIYLFALYAVLFINWWRNLNGEHCASFSPFRAHRSLGILLSSGPSNKEDHGHVIWHIALFTIATTTSKCFIDCIFLCFSCGMIFSQLCINGVHVYYLLLHWFTKCKYLLLPKCLV